MQCCQATDERTRRTYKNSSMQLSCTKRIVLCGAKELVVIVLYSHVLNASKTMMRCGMSIVKWQSALALIELP